MLMDALIRNLDGLSNSLPPDDTLFEQYRGSDMGAQRVQLCLEAVENRCNVFYTHVHDIEHAETYFENDPVVRELVLRVIDNAKIVYVSRDGRDVLTSMYSWMKAQQSPLAVASFSEFLRQANHWDRATYEPEYSRPAFWRYHVDCWDRHAEVPKFTFEGLRNDYAESLEALSEWTGRKLNRATVDVRRKPLLGFLPYGTQTRRLYKYLVEPLRSRRSHAHVFRKGVVGDYKKFFSDEDLDYFDAEVAGASRGAGESEPNR
jgi:hypothetical protein